MGGNLPVDSAIFLEFLPGSHQYLLTVLSIDWALAQVFANLVAWPLLGNLTCQQTEKNCTRSKNMGWRYFMIAMGGVALIMFFLRFVCFTLYESPKFLMGKGRDADAVKVVHEVARRNGKTSLLTLEDLQLCEALTTSATAIAEPPSHAQAAIRRNLAKVDLKHVKALFASRKLAYSTSLITAVWAFIGLGFPLYNAFLPFIQATRGVDFGDGSTYITYRNSLIIASLGVPGCLLGGFLVETPKVGRKGTLAASTILTGVFLFCSTTALNSTSLLGWYVSTLSVIPRNHLHLASSHFQTMLTPLQELRIQFHVQYYVRGAIQLHTRNLSHQRPWHWKRHRREREPRLWDYGSYYRDVCQSGDLCACLCQWRVVRGEWGSCFGTAF